MSWEQLLTGTTASTKANENDPERKTSIRTNTTEMLTGTCTPHGQNEHHDEHRGLIQKAAALECHTGSHHILPMRRHHATSIREAENTGQARCLAVIMGPSTGAGKCILEITTRHCRRGSSKNQYSQRVYPYHHHLLITHLALTSSFDHCL